MLVRRALPSMLTFDRLPFRLAYLGDDDLELRFRRNEPRDRVFLRLAAQARVEWVRRNGAHRNRKVEERSDEGAELIAGRCPLALSHSGQPFRHVARVHPAREGVHRKATRNAGVVTITSAARSPFFSATSFHQTAPAEWQTTERANPGPWADFQSEKFMFQVLRSWIHAFADPVTLMPHLSRNDAVDIHGHIFFESAETRRTQRKKATTRSTHRLVRALRSLSATSAAMRFPNPSVDSECIVPANTNARSRMDNQSSIYHPLVAPFPPANWYKRTS